MPTGQYERKGHSCNFQDLTGQQFNRLSVVELAPRRSGRTYWSCVCDCGKAVIVEAGNLKSGGTKSCGCFLDLMMRMRNQSRTIHGHTLKPSPDLELDRIDNDSHYMIGNVRWATQVVSKNNRRSYRTWRGRPVKQMLGAAA